jgi:uncharacterized protein (DUF433 family)
VPVAAAPVLEVEVLPTRRREDEAGVQTSGQGVERLERASRERDAPAAARRLSVRSIDWRTGQETPYQWRPPEGDNEVTLNPEVECGLPAVRRVRTETILHRFLARESAEEIADDFGLEVASVEHALRYEWSLTRAA